MTTEKTIDVLHGDCRDEVPKQGQFDFIFADPPFNIGHGYTGYDDRGRSTPATTMTSPQAFAPCTFLNNLGVPKMPIQRVSGLWLKDRKLPEGRYQQLGLGPVTLEQSTRRPTFPQEQHRRREDVRRADERGGRTCSGWYLPEGRLRNWLSHAPRPKGD